MEIEKQFIGMVGLGYWGKNILRNLHALGVPHTACDSNPGVVAEMNAMSANALID